jgi:uncharacterized membrane protein YeiH
MAIPLGTITGICSGRIQDIFRAGVPAVLRVGICAVTALVGTPFVAALEPAVTGRVAPRQVCGIE